jgi:hypothetical protein
MASFGVKPLDETAWESYPEDVAGRSVSGSFLHNATVSLFERHGFERTRRLGKNRWVVTKAVRPCRSARLT